MSREHVRTPQPKTPTAAQNRPRTELRSRTPISSESARPTDPPGPPSLLSSISILAPVQLAQLHGASPQARGGAAVQSIAASGFQGAAGPLPGLRRVQALFGHHDLSGVRAYTGRDSVHAARQLGARAFTRGHQIGFDDPNPSLHIVAHEAAHVVQQRAGVHLKSGVGEVGDAYEQQAEAVGRAVSRGESVERLLDQSIGPPSGSPPSAPSAGNVQLYTEDRDPVLECPRKVSENGELIVMGGGSQTGFYATPAKIKESNQRLAAAGSFIRFLTAAESYSNKKVIDDPDNWDQWQKDYPSKTEKDKETGIARTYYQVKPRWATKPKEKLGWHDVEHPELKKQLSLDKINTEIYKNNRKRLGKHWNNMNLWWDCGRSSSAIMGTGDGYRKSVYRDFASNAMKESKQDDLRPNGLESEMFEQLPAWLLANQQYIVDSHGAKTDKKTNAITGFKRLGTSVCSLKNLIDAYYAMSNAGRSAFDAAVGLNNFAAPEIGEGYAMITHTQAQGFHQNGNIYGYHWGGVVARDGKDSVTLEAAAQDANAFSMGPKSWSFEMYGPTVDQSFYRRHLGSGQHGSHAVAIRVRVPQHRREQEQEQYSLYDDFPDLPRPKIVNANNVPPKGNANNEQPKAPVPNNAAPIPNKAPVPNNAAPIPNKAPIPQNVAPIPNKAPIPQNVAPIPNKAPIPNIKEQQPDNNLALASNLDDKGHKPPPAPPLNQDQQEALELAQAQRKLEEAARQKEEEERQILEKKRRARLARQDQLDRAHRQVAPFRMVGLLVNAREQRQEFQLNRKRQASVLPKRRFMDDVETVLKSKSMPHSRAKTVLADLLKDEKEELSKANQSLDDSQIKSSHGDDKLDENNNNNNNKLDDDVADSNMSSHLLNIPDDFFEPKKKSLPYYEQEEDDDDFSSFFNASPLSGVFADLGMDPKLGLYYWPADIVALGEKGQIRDTFGIPYETARELYFAALHYRSY